MKGFGEGKSEGLEGWINRNQRKDRKSERGRGLERQRERGRWLSIIHAEYLHLTSICTSPLRNILEDRYFLFSFFVVLFIVVVLSILLPLCYISPSDTM